MNEYEGFKVGDVIQFPSEWVATIKEFIPIWTFTTGVSHTGEAHSWQDMGVKVDGMVVPVSYLFLPKTKKLKKEN